MNKVIKLKLVEIDDVRAGDTVLHHGEVKSVCKKDIKRGGFCGTTLFGDSYRMGYDLVKVLQYK